MDEESKIIIRNTSNKSDAEVIRRVATIIDGGRISGNGTHYCYLTKYNDDIWISSKRGKASDTFNAY